jgi:hypothetical protein
MNLNDPREPSECGGLHCDGGPLSGCQINKSLLTIRKEDTRTGHWLGYFLLCFWRPQLAQLESCWRIGWTVHQKQVTLLQQYVRRRNGSICDSVQWTRKISEHLLEWLGSWWILSNNVYQNYPIVSPIQTCRSDPWQLLLFLTILLTAGCNTACENVSVLGVLQIQ